MPTAHLPNVPGIQRLLRVSWPRASRARSSPSVERRRVCRAQESRENSRGRKRSKRSAGPRCALTSERHAVLVLCAPRLSSRLRRSLESRAQQPKRPPERHCHVKSWLALRPVFVLGPVRALNMTAAIQHMKATQALRLALIGGSICQLVTAVVSLVRPACRAALTPSYAARASYSRACASAQPRTDASRLPCQPHCPALPQARVACAPSHNVHRSCRQLNPLIRVLSRQA